MFRKLVGVLFQTERPLLLADGADWPHFKKMASLIRDPQPFVSAGARKLPNFAQLTCKWLLRI